MTGAAVQARRSRQAAALDLRPEQMWTSADQVRYTIVRVDGFRVYVTQEGYGEQVFELDREFFLRCTGASQ